MQRFLKIILSVMLCGAAWLSFDAWYTPLEVRQQAAAARVTGGPDEFAAAKAFTEALWGSMRWAAPLAVLVALVALFQLHRLAPFLSSAGRGFQAATATGNEPHDARQTWLIRGFVAAWLIIAMTQFGESVVQRMRDWQSYGLHAGQTSLPNLSDTNYLLIRYLEEATPPDAKILVLSDQKLFFLSYYLLPRRLYHPMHPDSEFVIPLAQGERQLAAYTRVDLPAQYLEELQPDYVLEYFEGEAFVDPARVREDQGWLRFLGQGKVTTEQPRIQVILRPYPSEGTP
ncbi:hypothetical protein [Symmachiella macrocystis]|nr:hypothetical protein [Symmachiella macrocystis]